MNLLLLLIGIAVAKEKHSNWGHLYFSGGYSEDAEESVDYTAFGYRWAPKNLVLGLTGFSATCDDVKTSGYGLEMGYFVKNFYLNLSGGLGSCECEGLDDKDLTFYSSELGWLMTDWQGINLSVSYKWTEIEIDQRDDTIGINSIIFTIMLGVF